ncbi:tyrosine-type recombinase/integrase [Bacillus sp. DE0042]|uniref:tyrosine-type recombinase/integrase n=1 Tax=Bacillus sp. DE0042 TaxID=2584950 RepID=UPI0011A2A4D6|nr:tyrosine-type recombinase/integrase [Bacillus sp. DE0042]
MDKNNRMISSVEISKKISQMNDGLQGFWGKDKWDVRECPIPSAIELCQYPSLRIRYVYFEKIKNPWIKIELKYFFYYHMINNIWSAKTVWIRKGTVIGRMLDFLSVKYPNLSSITEVSVEKSLMEYRTYLIESGIKTTVTNKKLNEKQEKVEIKANSYYVTALKQFIEFYEDFYFDGEEWDKDIWDRRKLSLPMDKVNPTQREYSLNFSGIQNMNFRELSKRYCRFRLNTLSFSGVRHILGSLVEFFNFISKNNGIQKINQITRKDIEDYLSMINQSGISSSTIGKRLGNIEGIFSTMRRLEWDDAPSKILIYPEDYPKVPNNKPRYIDDYVLEQLNNKIDKLPQEIATMTMIIQECGMRISELCTLKTDCLIVDSEGDYFLKSYQWKMKKEHIVPISKEVGALIKSQEEFVKNEYGLDCLYLFPRKDKSPLKQDTFRNHLNQLAYDEKIVDRNGRVFRFQAHAFRHTVGTKMINNGVPQHIVQKFLGHESPEMTAKYAHIFDETLKEEFSKFREKIITNNGSIIEITENATDADDIDLQWFKKNINAQALPNGYCRLPVITGPCPHANACLDCTHFCTSKKFIKEHENHLSRTKILLEQAKNHQWQRQIETNQRVKEKLEQIIRTIKESG